MEINQDESEVLETTETDAEAVETTEVVEETVEEKIARLEREKQELEGKNKQLYARVKKTEEPKTAASQEFSLTEKDRIFLAKADIHEDDLDEVLDRAKSKGISVKDALAQVKPLLDARTEERRTAAATHTKGGARGAAKPTGNDLLEKAERTGEIPDSDDGIQAIAEARLAKKKNRGS